MTNKPIASLIGFLFLFVSCQDSTKGQLAEQILSSSTNSEQVNSNAENEQDDDEVEEEKKDEKQVVAKPVEDNKEDEKEVVATPADADEEGGEVEGGLADPNVLNIGGNTFKVRDASKARFDDDGNLISGPFVMFVLQGENTATVGANEYTFADGSGILFHGNGTVFWGKLARSDTAVLGGQRYSLRNGSEIKFYGNGVISEGFLSVDHEVRVGENDFTIQEGYINFHSNGAVRITKLSGSFTATIGGQRYSLRDGSKISFRSNGTVDSAYLANGRWLKFNVDGVPVE